MIQAGTLIAFPSVVNADGCNVEIQISVADRDAEVPNERRIRSCIGVICPLDVGEKVDIVTVGWKF